MKGFISEILVIAISIATAIIIINAAYPIVEEGKKSQSVNDARQILKTVDAVMNQMAFESTGAKRVINIDLPDGVFVLSGKDDRIKIRLENTNLLRPSTLVEEENIVYQGGGALDSYESDILGDNQTDLVLENSAVLLAIKKLGNSTNHVFINTSSLITQIRNKVQNVNITSPRSGIFINDDVMSSYGAGYTELPREQNARTGVIILHMSLATNNMTYDALFTLSASSDFIELEIKNIAT